MKDRVSKRRKKCEVQRSFSIKKPNVWPQPQKKNTMWGWGEGVESKTDPVGGIAKQG